MACCASYTNSKAEAFEPVILQADDVTMAHMINVTANGQGPDHLWSL